MNWLEFFKEWSPYIVSGLIVVLDVLILLLKRRPQTVDDFKFVLQYVMNEVPYFINKVERNGDGAAKKSEVIDEALDYFKHHLRRELTSDETQVAIDFISSQIESVLSTPQKKGVYYGTK